VVNRQKSMMEEAMRHIIFALALLGATAAQAETLTIGTFNTESGSDTYASAPSRDYPRMDFARGCSGHPDRRFQYPRRSCIGDGQPGLGGIHNAGTGGDMASPVEPGQDSVQPKLQLYAGPVLSHGRAEHQRKPYRGARD